MTKGKKTQKNKKNQRKGFTLIEILVVATIIIVVAAIGLVSYSNAQVKARDAQRAQDLENVRTTLLLFRTENGYYPTAGILLPSRVAFSFPRQVLSRLEGMFRVPEAQAALSIGTPTPTPILEEEVVISTPTPEATKAPTPTPTSIIGTPVPSATPTPTPVNDDEDTVPAEKLAYDEMMDAMITDGYLTSAEIPRDPVNNNTYYYGYSSDGAIFELTARLEIDGSVMTVTN